MSTSDDSGAPFAPSAGTSPSPGRRTWARSAARLALELALVLLVVAGVQAWRASGLVERGELAPPLVLADLDGQVVDLHDLRGRPVLVHFWATWCGVCRREFGSLRSVERRRGDAVLLTVVEDGDDADHVRAFAAERGLTYPILLGTPDAIARWRIGVFPTNYYIDRDGKIVGRQTGFATGWGMRFRLWLAGR